MDIQWFSNNPKGVATIYKNNITLNTVASNHFKNSYGLILGYSEKTKSLLIKSISKEDINLGLYKGIDIHNISIKPSYGRISGRSIIDNLCEFYPIDFTNNTSNKYVCEWNPEEKTLNVYLERRLS